MVNSISSTTNTFDGNKRPNNDSENKNNLNIGSNLLGAVRSPNNEYQDVARELLVEVEKSVKAKAKKRVYAPVIEFSDNDNDQNSYKIVAVEVPHGGVRIAEKAAKRCTKVEPFSFEERDKRLQKEKEEKIQKILEEEKRMHEFHANPPPNFIQPSIQYQTVLCTDPKPLKFRTEDRIQERNKTKHEVQKQPIFKARPATVLQKPPFEPKKGEYPLTDITGFHLNTEERAKRREEFNLLIKQKEAELESLRLQRRKEEEEQLAREIRKLRKEIVHKANPVPDFKPLPPILSSAPLTIPQSPNFASRNLTHKPHKH
ncbi:targeting protein for Xklp2-like isoform X2 [Lycorma delicatula]